MQLIVNNDEMLGKTTDKTLHLALIEKDKEIERLNNAFNELEKHICQEWYCFDNESVEFEVAKNILDKLKELKGGE